MVLGFIDLEIPLDLDPKIYSGFFNVESFSWSGEEVVGVGMYERHSCIGVGPYSSKYATWMSWDGSKWQIKFRGYFDEFGSFITVENYISDHRKGDVYSIASSISEPVLEQNYPNPFNPVTVISYVIPAPSYVVLKVYDILGREVGTLVDEYKKEGRYSVKFDATGLSSGVYFYSLSVNGKVIQRKMIVVK